MTIHYVLKNETAAVRYIAGNLLNHGYHFVSTAWIPEGKDEVLTDARLLVRYQNYLSKEQQYRRFKGGQAKVKYMRCGRLIVIAATKGRSPFFEMEDWFDAREKRLCIGPYSIRVDKATGKVKVRLHKEAQRRLRKEWYEMARDDVRTWEDRIFNLDLLPFKGVQDNVYSLVKDLNIARKLLRKPPLDWSRCIRRRIAPEPVFLPSPPEIEELMGWYPRRR